MVRRVFELVYKEVRGLHQAAYVLGLFAFGSQILALVRDRLLAHQFGAGMELDLYYAAFRIPDLLYVLFASTLSVYVLIPFVAGRIKGEDSSKARELLSQICTAFILIYCLLGALMFIVAPYVLPLIFPGLASHADRLVVISRILLLQPLFLGISSLFGVVTQLGRRFVLYAVSPLIYNVGIIVGVAVLYPLWGLNGLVIGVVLGALGHMLVQLPLVQKSPLAFSFTVSIAWRELAEILRISVPRALTLAMQQIVIAVLLGIASLMAVGSVSVFQLAYNLQGVPLAIIGASYSVAAFPFLADLFAQKKMDVFRVHIVTALRHMIFWSVPATGLIIVLRAQIVRVILGSGAFNWDDTRLTAAVLAVLSISLCAQAFNLLIVRAFYAGGHTRTPFLVTFFGSIFAIALSLAAYGAYAAHPEWSASLGNMLRIGNVRGAEVVVLGLSYSLAICLQTAVLYLLAFKRFDVPSAWFLPNIGRALCAALVGSSCAYGALNLIVSGINDTAFLGIFLQGLAGGVCGIAGVIVTYYLLRSPEMEEIYRAFHSRIFKSDVVAPQEDVL